MLLIDKLTVKRQGKNVLNNANLHISKGQNILVTGTSGSGKTTLLEAISKQIQYTGTIDIRYAEECSLTTRVLMLQQHNDFKSLANTSDFYYQQRYNVYESGDAHTVAEELTKLSKKLNIATQGCEHIDSILQQLKLEHRKHATLLQLSSGEQKRFQFAKALLISPQLLMLDNPLTGIDKEGRDLICGIIDAIAAQGTTVVIADSNHHHLPACLTHFTTLENGRTSQLTDINILTDNIITPSIAVIPFRDAEVRYNTIASLKNVSLSIGDKNILENINWTILPGECWHLKGANGAGKSTLLSLLTGDNPQAYSADITLFDKKRGSGESIWDIKKKIGYLSPEFHRHFPKQVPIWQAIASGLFDTSGLFQQLSKEQQAWVNEWLQAFGWYNDRKEPIANLPAGMQRMVMLVRALIKNPPLLILDEPCQGMDGAQQKQFLATLDGIMQTGGKSLVYVTHNEEELPLCINRRIILANKTGSTINVKN